MDSLPSSHPQFSRSPSIRDKISGPTAFDQSPMALRGSIRDTAFSFRNLPQRATSFARNGSIVSRGPDALSLPKVESIKAIAESEQRRKALASLSTNEMPQPPQGLQSRPSFKRSSVPVSLPGPVKPLTSILDQHQRFMSYQAQESILTRTSDPFPKQSPKEVEANLRATVSQEMTSPLEQEFSTTSLYSNDSATSPIPSADITPILSRRNSRSSSRNNRVGFGSVEIRGETFAIPSEGCLSDSSDALLNRCTSLAPSRRILQRQEARGRHDETFAAVSSKLLAMLEPRYKRSYDHSSFQMARQSLGI
jgi:hypothetical protein